MHSPEPYQISLRLYRALQAKAVLLEVDALRDELAATSMQDSGQIQRHQLLIQAQRDEADRLRDFLTRTRVRMGGEAAPSR